MAEQVSPVRGAEGRNYGIDLLKIVSMIMVPILHVLGQGGILALARPDTFRGALAWLMEAAAYCAVDNYALISGYVGYGKKFSGANLIYLYLQVLFYRLAVTGLFCLFQPEAVSWNAALGALLPLRYGHWYFTAYFCMYFFTPFFNRGLRTLDRRGCGRLLLALFFVFSLLPTLLQADAGGTNYGYSALWLGVLYLAGAVLKKYRIEEQVTKGRCLLLFALCTAVTWLVGLCYGRAATAREGYVAGVNLLMQYISPTVVGCALSMTLLFARLRIGPAARRAISFFAPLSFAVYLIHTEPLVWNRLFPGAFVSYAALPSYLLLPAVLGTALAIWLGCSLIDRLRLALFDLCRIRRFCLRLEELLLRGLARLFPQLWGAQAPEK